MVWFLMNLFRPGLYMTKAEQEEPGPKALAQLTLE